LARLYVDSARVEKETIGSGKKLLVVFSGAPRVSRARGKTQFWRPHPARSWQHRWVECVGNKGAPKADWGPAIACIYLFLNQSENFLWLWRRRIDVRTFESWKSSTVEWRI